MEIATRLYRYILNFGHLAAIQLSKIGCPAGLSVAQSDRVTGKQLLKCDMLTSRKARQK
jgi:hypothetical protein